MKIHKPDKGMSEKIVDTFIITNYFSSKIEKRKIDKRFLTFEGKLIV